MSYSKTLALNTKWDLAITTRDDDLKTLTVTCDHRMNYQLVRSALLSTKKDRGIENPFWLDWTVYTSLDAPFQLLASQIFTLISTFEHVESIDLTGGEYNITNDTLSITGICFRSDCDTSNLTCVNI